VVDSKDRASNNDGNIRANFWRITFTINKEVELTEASVTGELLVTKAMAE
jgi:hypothetical protein